MAKKDELMEQLVRETLKERVKEEVDKRMSDTNLDAIFKQVLTPELMKQSFINYIEKDYNSCFDDDFFQEGDQNPWGMPPTLLQQQESKDLCKQILQNIYDSINVHHHFEQKDPHQSLDEYDIHDVWPIKRDLLFEDKELHRPYFDASIDSFQKKESFFQTEKKEFLLKKASPSNLSLTQSFQLSLYKFSLELKQHPLPLDTINTFSPFQEQYQQCLSQHLQC